MKNIYKLILLITALIGFNSCSCPVEESDPVFLCETRLATIDRFNPNFTVRIDPVSGEAVTDLDSTYSISMFLFPNDASSSGSLPNDARFQNSSQLVIAKEPFLIDGVKYYAAIMDGFPSNDLLAGDILVDSVDLSAATGPGAYFRIYGNLLMIDRNYNSEDAQAFCDYVTAHTDTIQSASNLIREKNGQNDYKYGKNQPGAVESTYNSSSIMILDEQLKVIGSYGAVGVPNPTPDVISKLNANAIKYVRLRVEPGNVYTYLAKNGKRFVFFVSEIRAASIFPYRQRVTIMFYPLDK